VVMSGPSSKPKRDGREPVFVPHPDDLEDVRKGFAELERGEGIALTPEELDRWAETGELPERVEKWAEQRSSSRHGT
jgi:hypothetical protein